ncbi:Uncharacterised protein [Mycobacteroides abscessus subsp. abscessus]|nr:Uncharacterised protein [Mycobacteroides abscessus subsp. abscessus]
MPDSSVQSEPIILAISVAMASASCGLLVAFPSWSTSNVRTPGGCPAKLRSGAADSSSPSYESRETYWHRAGCIRYERSRK